MRSGHACGTSQQSYIDRNVVVLSALSGKALNGYGDRSFNGQPHRAPNLDCIGHTQQGAVERFMNQKKTAADAIQDACWLWVLDCECELGLRDPNTPITGRAKPTTMAMGMRYQKVKTARTKAEDEARKNKRQRTNP